MTSHLRMWFCIFGETFVVGKVIPWVNFILVAFHWCLSDKMSLRLSGTLLSILANFNTAMIPMVSELLLISSHPSPLGTILRESAAIVSSYSTASSVLWQDPRNFCVLLHCGLQLRKNALVDKLFPQLS